MKCKKETALSVLLIGSLGLSTAFSTINNNHSMFNANNNSNLISAPKYNNDIANCSSNDAAASLFANNIYEWFVDIFKQNNLTIDDKKTIVNQLEQNGVTGISLTSNNQFSINEGDHESTQSKNNNYKYGPMTYFFNYFLYHEVTKLDKIVAFKKYQFTQDTSNEKEYQFNNDFIFGKDTSGNGVTVPFTKSNFTGYFGSFIYWIDILPYLEVNNYTTRAGLLDSKSISPEMFYLDSGSLNFGNIDKAQNYVTRLNEQFFLWTQLFSFYYDYGTSLLTTSTNYLDKNFFGQGLFSNTDELDGIWINNYCSLVYNFDFTNWLNNSSSFHEIDANSSSGAFNCAKKFTGNLACLLPIYFSDIGHLDWSSKTLRTINYGGGIDSQSKGIFSGYQEAFHLAYSGTFLKSRKIANFVDNDETQLDKAVCTVIKDAFTQMYPTSGNGNTIANATTVYVPQLKKSVPADSSFIGSVNGNLKNFNTNLLITSQMLSTGPDGQGLAVLLVVNNKLFSGKSGIIYNMFAKLDINNPLFKGEVVQAINKLKQKYEAANLSITALPQNEGKTLDYSGYSEPNGINNAFAKIKFLGDWNSVYNDYQGFANAQKNALTNWISYIGNKFLNDNLGYKTAITPNDFYSQKDGIKNENDIQKWLSIEHQFSLEQQNFVNHNPVNNKSNFTWWIYVVSAVGAFLFISLIWIGIRRHKNRIIAYKIPKQKI